MEITKDENTPPLNSSQSSSGKNSHSIENSNSKSAGNRTVFRNLSANFNDLPVCSHLVKVSFACFWTKKIEKEKQIGQESLMSGQFRAKFVIYIDPHTAYQSRLDCDKCQEHERLR